MLNNKKTISIDIAHLERTIQLCQEEQQECIKKQNISIFSILFRYIMIDFRLYFLYATIGLLITIVILSKNPTLMEYVLPIYFFSLGLFSLYEYYKASYYNTTEIITPVYLHPGRSLLIKAASIACIEFIIFVILMLFFGIHQKLVLAHTIMVCLVPLYMIQILIINLLRIVKGYISAISIYVLLYSLYYALFEFYLRYQISLQLSNVTLAIIMSLYLINLFRLYSVTRKHGGNIYGISFKAY